MDHKKTLPSSNIINSEKKTIKCDFCEVMFDGRLLFGAK